MPESFDINTPVPSPRGEDRGPAKESEKITLSPWPQPTHYRAWRLTLIEEVIAASTNPDATFRWISFVGQAGVNFDDLRKCHVPFSGPPSLYGTLDAMRIRKLANAKKYAGANITGGGASVGRVVASNSRGPQFESSHRQVLIKNI